MQNAYDIKLLGEKLKSKGLDIAEESAKIVFDSVVEWFEESAKISPNVYDDLIILAMPQIKKVVYEKIDLIDKKQG